MNKFKRSTLLAAAVAAALAGQAYGKGTGYLFVSSEKDNAVQVLDGKTHELVKTIQTAERPRHLQFDPRRERIFVAAGRGNAIDIIDVAKLELVDRIAGVEDPELFDLSADGKTLYISLEEDAALGILDLDEHFDERDGKPALDVAAPDEDDNRDEYAGEAEEDEEEGEEHAADDDDDEGVDGLTTVEVGEEPEGVLVAPDGKTVYVTSEVANIVHVVDTASREIRANVVAGNRPRRFALTPDQETLLVSNELSGSVSIIDTASNKAVGEITFKPKGFRPEDVTPVGLTLSRDGKTLYVGLGRANHVAVVNLESRRVEDYILVGTRAWNTTLNRDESLLYVVNGLSDDISIIDTARRKVVKSIPVGRVPHTVLIDD